ncbi:MAG: TerB family tellurite resistance protein [bacterium]|nr:TerB family tellurite resistance protein [Candidatus Sumerlaeota bacterium]
MENHEKAAIGAICLMAAFADGAKGEEEQEKLKEVFESLEIPGQAAIFQRVLLHQTTLEKEAAALQQPELRQLAFEMAVSICDADDVTTSEEREFLEKLRGALQLSVPEARKVQEEAESITGGMETPYAVDPVKTDAQPQPAPAASNEAPLATEAISAEVDSSILRNAIICGGLELLPQSLSTVAIIPLQMRMVFNIGKSYGYQLDRGHIKELLATVGVGMTSQVFEGVARKFLGNLFKGVGGSLAGGVADGATGAAVSFASTYALGKVAKSYYSSGRQLKMAALKELFQKEVIGAKDVYAKHAGEVEAKSRTLDTASIMGMIRNKKSV